MNAYASSFIITLAVFLNLQVSLCQEVDFKLEFSELKKKFSSKKNDDVDKPFQSKLTALNKKYLDALSNAKKKAAASGDLDLVITIQAELDRFNSSPTVSEDSKSEEPIVLSLQTIYLTTIAQYQTEKDENKSKLITMYQAALEKLQQNATKGLDLVTAKEIKTLREQITCNTPIKTPHQTPTKVKQNAGELFIAGSLNGRPFEVPAELKSRKIDWIKTHKEGVYAATQDGDIFHIDQTGITKQKIKNVKSFVPKGPWSGTELSKEGRLRWKVKSGSVSEEGTLRDVIKYEIGGRKGSYAYESLVALTTAGEIEVITINNIDFDWNFDKWKKDKVFSDIAMCNWKGVGGVVLALTTKGELHAFNQEGHFILPEDLNTASGLSIDAGGDGMRYHVIMKSGDVYGWRGGLENEFPLTEKLRLWAKTPVDKFAGKKPVRIDQKYTWKAVQFEDETWEVWRGVNSFSERLFVEEIGDGHFKDLQAERDFVVGIR